MKPVDFLPGARLDFDTSFDWYAARSSVAAERFSVAVESALRRIADGPE
jgi:plasmid stabilization system protein ParE